MIRKRLLISVLLLSMLTTACDNLITSFRAGFAASKPFVQSLVTSGAITQAKADAAVRDIDDGIRAAERGDTCFRQAAGDKVTKRIAKAKCYVALAQDLRVILARHNLGGNARLDQIALIVQAAIEAFEAYNQSVTGMGMMDGPAGDDADKLLEKKMDDLNNQLKELKR